jgi:hypothetical protein
MPNAKTLDAEMVRDVVSTPNQLEQELGAVVTVLGDLATVLDESCGVEEAPPICAVHDLPMVRQQGKHGPL